MGPATKRRIELENRVTTFKDQFRSFLEGTQTARERSERCRDYYDLRQLTAEEVATLQSRGQAPVVCDYIKEQVDHIVGMAINNFGDPRALPRNRADEGASDAATDALRFLSDQNDFKDTCFKDLAENIAIEGYGAAIIEIEDSGSEVPDIVVRNIPWDRFYYDPYSRSKDFSDAKYMGIVVWMDKADVKAMYPDASDDIDLAFTDGYDSDGDTFEDRPLWLDKKRGRIRVCQHYYLDEGDWKVCHFAGSIELMPEETSPFLDEKGEPVCPIVAVSLYVNRDNERYGYVEKMIDIQDEINKRRSKSLFLFTSRQVIMEDGAVADEYEAKNELKKPDGIVKIRPNMRFEIAQTGDMAQGQLALYQEAVQKMTSATASLAMADEAEGMSGRAVRSLQAVRSTQFTPFMTSLKNWRIRVYRQMWLRVRQYWDAPKWVRVTDDESNLKWVGLNQPVTYGEALQEKAQQGDQQAVQALQQMMQAQDPRLNQVFETKNQVAELDVDIIIDESPDTVTIQQEQFETIATLASTYGPQAVPFKALLQLSSLKGKKEVMDMLEGDGQMMQLQQAVEQLQAQLQEVTQGLIAQQAQADVALTNAKAQTEQAKAAKTAAEVQQTELENVLLAAFPDVQPNVII
jgi:hypothetical protein